MIRLKKLLLTLFMASLAAFIVINAATRISRADTDFINNQGAYVRIGNSYSSAYGIKFTASVGTLVEDGEYHMMIIPVTYYEKYEEYVENSANPEDAKNAVQWLLDLKAAHSEMPLAIVDAAPEAGGVINASIVSVQWQNLNTAFLGMAYCTVGGEVAAVAEFEYKDDVIAQHARTVAAVVEGFFNDDPDAFYEENEYDAEKIADVEAYLNGLVKNTILQANDVDEEDAESADFAISLNESSKTMYIGETATLELSPNVGTSLAEWTTSNGSVATVSGGEVTAENSGSATVTASLYGAEDSAAINVLPMKFLNASDITRTGTETSGTITLTRTEAPAPNSRKSATLGLMTNYTNAFTEVSFTTPAAGRFANKTTLNESGIHIGLRRNSADLLTTDYLTGWSVDYKYFANDNMPIALNCGGFINNYYSGLGVGVGQVLYGSAGAINNLTPETNYKIMSGVFGTGNNAYVYFSLKDASDNVLLLIRWSISEVVAAHNHPSVTGIADSGFFTVHVSRDDETTIGYNVITSIPQEILDYDAPTLTQSGCTISWDNVAWASEYQYSVDGGAYVAANSNSVTLSSGTYSSFALKAVNGTSEKVVTLTDLFCPEDDIEIANMTNVSSTELSHARGNITFTNSAAVVPLTDSNRMSNTTAYMTLKGTFTTQFIKVGFTPTNAQYARNGIAIAMRQTNLVPSALAPSGSGFWSISPWNSGNCLGLTCNGHVSDINSAYGNQHKGRLMYGSYSTFNSLDTSKTYYAIAGILDGIDDEYIYFGLEDEQGTLLVLVRWAQSEIVNSGVSAASYFTNLPASGSFVLKSWAASGRSLTWEIINDAASILSDYEDITLTQSGCTVSWNKVGWANEYQYSIDGGAYVSANSNSVTLSSGTHTSFSVKAIKGTIEKTATLNNLICSDDSIAFGNMASMTSSSLSYASGNATFTSAADVPTTYTNSSATKSSYISLKNNFSTEFIKVGFNAISTKYNEQKISIGLRNNSEAQGATTHDTGFSISYWAYGTTLAFKSNGQTSDVINIGGRHKGEILYGATSALNGFTVGQKYYYVVGAETDTANSDGNATYYFIYFAILDGNENCKLLVRWSTYAIVSEGSAANYYRNFPASGWYNIKSYADGERTLEWKIIDRPVYLNYVHSNMKDVTETVNSDGTYSVKFTPTDNVATSTGNNANPASTINIIDKQGENVFVQVKFTAIDSDISKNGIAIAYRTPSFNDATANTRRLMFVSSWAYSYSISANQNYDNHTNLVTGKQAGITLTVGKEYMITFGMHTDYNGTPDDTSDDTRILYLFISLIENDTETLKYAKTFNWTAITNGSPTYLAEGYIQVFSWCEGERTLTVGLTDYDTVNTEYISQISA